MIDIVTLKGDKYSFDPVTLSIFKNGEQLSGAEAEPLYSDSPDGDPEFCGIYLKSTNRIVSRTGKINPVSDANTVE